MPALAAVKATNPLSRLLKKRPKSRKRKKIAKGLASLARVVVAMQIPPGFFIRKIRRDFFSAHPPFQYLPCTSINLLQIISMKRFITTLAIICSGYATNACTTFFINKNGQMLFGRNYDWITDAGQVCTNLKGLYKTSMKTEDGETISWVSKYGSVTFNQYGKEFPTGGMNESGLVVELMWLDETKYPAADKRPAIGVLQWIQYQLDNCSSIEEVIATDKILRIASIGTTPLHYLVADANGNAATIEFLDGKMVAHKGSELKQPVLTNSIYKESVRAFETANSPGQQASFAYGNNSIDRFKEACSMIRKLDELPKTISTIDYAFSILEFEVS